MSAWEIALLVVLAVAILAKAILFFLAFSAVIEENYRSEMRRHGFDPGPLPWYLRLRPMQRRPFR